MYPILVPQSNGFPAYVQPRSSHITIKANKQEHHLLTTTELNTSYCARPIITYHEDTCKSNMITEPSPDTLDGCDLTTRTIRMDLFYIKDATPQSELRRRTTSARYPGYRNTPTRTMMQSHYREHQLGGQNHTRTCLPIV